MDMCRAGNIGENIRHGLVGKARSHRVWAAGERMAMSTTMRSKPPYNAMDKAIVHRCLLPYIAVDRPNYEANISIGHNFANEAIKHITYNIARKTRQVCTEVHATASRFYRAFSWTNVPLNLIWAC